MKFTLVLLCVLFGYSLHAQDRINEDDSLQVIHFWDSLAAAVFSNNTVLIRQYMEDDFYCPPCFDNEPLDSLLHGVRRNHPTITTDSFFLEFFHQIFDSTMIAVMSTERPQASIFFNSFCVFFSKYKPKHECDGMNAIFIIRRQQRQFILTGYTTVP